MSINFKVKAEVNPVRESRELAIQLEGGCGRGLSQAGLFVISGAAPSVTRNGNRKAIVCEVCSTLSSLRDGNILQ